MNASHSVKIAEPFDAVGYGLFHFATESQAEAASLGQVRIPAAINRGPQWGRKKTTMKASSAEHEPTTSLDGTPIPGATLPAGGESSPRQVKAMKKPSYTWDSPIPPSDEGETILSTGNYVAQILNVERLEPDGRKAPTVRLSIQLVDERSGKSDRTTVALKLVQGAEGKCRELFGAFLKQDVRVAFVPDWESLKGSKAIASVSCVRWGEDSLREGEWTGTKFISSFTAQALSEEKEVVAS